MFPLAAIVSTRRYIVPSESGVRVISESLYREWLSSLGADEVESFQMLSEVRELWVEEIPEGYFSEDQRKESWCVGFF